MAERRVLEERMMWCCLGVLCGEEPVAVPGVSRVPVRTRMTACGDSLAFEILDRVGCRFDEDPYPRGEPLYFCFFDAKSGGRMLYSWPLRECGRATKGVEMWLTPRAAA